MLNIPKQQVQRTLPPEGTHFAHVYQLIHIGTVPYVWQGEEKMRNKVRIGFELTEEKHVFKDGEEAKPFVISSSYTLSLGEKSNLRPIVEGILGKKLTEEEIEHFDLESIIGKSCLVSVIYAKSQNGTLYANIASTSPLVKGMAISPQINNSFVLTYGDNWNQKNFDSLPDFLKEEMRTSSEYQTKFSQTTAHDLEDIDYGNETINPDDIPF